MQLENLLRPYYVFRPTQIAVRIARQFMDATPLKPVRLPWRVTAEIDPADDVCRAVWNNGIYDLCVSEVLWRLAEPDTLALDVGANVGFMTSLLAARVGRMGQVIAFEPQPAVLPDLERNLQHVARAPHCAPVELVRAALSSASGEVRFVMPGARSTRRGEAHVAPKNADGAASAGQVVRVPATTIDDVLGDRDASLMKVDVEGHEAAVFAGAARTLARGGIRHIVYEDHRRASSEVHEQLEGYGYEVLALGTRWNGLRAGSREADLVPADEAPSYLATVDGPAARRALARSGWRVLRGR